MHPAEVERKLRGFVEECGTQSLAADALGVSPQYLSKVLNGEKAIGPSILSKLSIRRTIRITTTYEAGV